MKTEEAIKAFYKMKNISEADLEEYDSYKPSIKKLESYSAEFNSSLSDQNCMATEWPNGEGFDFIFYGKKDSNLVSLHLDEIELMLILLNKFDYFTK